MSRTRRGLVVPVAMVWGFVACVDDPDTSAFGRDEGGDTAAEDAAEVGPQPDSSEEVGPQPDSAVDSGSDDTVGDDVDESDSVEPDIEEPLCVPDCANGGDCVAANTCDCSGTGYTGPGCGTPVCSPVCATGTTCVAPNRCEAVVTVLSQGRFETLGARLGSGTLRITAHSISGPARVCADKLCLIGSISP